MTKTRILLLSLSVSSLAILAVWFFKTEPRPSVSVKELNSADQPKTSGAGKALDHWYASRAYPTGIIQQQSWAAEAHSYLEQSLSTAKSESSQWESMGPHNIGGRALELAFNPQNPTTIWLGSASGGLWVTRTAGLGTAGWQRVETGFPVLGVAAISINPRDSNEIYIGTGEVYNYRKAGDRVGIRFTRGTYGVGILKSTDGGTSWQASLDWQYDELKGVQDILMHPQHTDSLLAATSEGIYRSIDGGQTWEMKQNILMANYLLQEPGNPETVMAAVGNMGTDGGGIYLSTDFGENWVKRSHGLPGFFTGKITLAVTADTPYVYYASVADSISGIGLFRSGDQGANWTMVNNTNFAAWQGWYSHDVAVNPFQRNQLFCVGIEAYKSWNEGTLLEKKSFSNRMFLEATPAIGGPEGLPTYVHADIHQVIYHPSIPDHIYFATDGGMFVSKNGGETFEGRNGGLQTTQFYPSTSSSRQDENLYIGGLQDNATAIYKGNKAWYRTIGGDGSNTAIRPDNDSVIYGSFQYLRMLRSVNRGRSFDWVDGIAPAGEGVAAFIAPFIICESDNDIMYAATNLVQKSLDGGFTWTVMNGEQALNGNPINTLSANPLNASQVFASTIPFRGQGAILWRSNDGGESFENVTGNLPDRYYSDIVFDPSEPNRVYVVISGFGTPHVYLSEDGGDTFTAFGTGLPDLPHNNMVADPAWPAHLYICNDLGVYVSTDAGANWEAFGTGLPGAVLGYDLDVSYANRKLRLATHGNGAWQADLLPVPAAADPVTQIQLFPNPSRNQAQLSFYSNSTQIVAVRIVDTRGKVLSYDREIPVEQGRIYLNLPVEKLQQGLYFVSLFVEGEVSTQRLLVRANR